MKKNMAGLILVLFATALFMTGCEKKAQEKEEAQEASARQLVIQKQTQTEIAEKKIEEKRRELPNQAQIEMEVILQKPELPTGCESVALTMVLKQKGYPIEKTTIAEEYLIYNRDNYASGYVGDPSTYGGVGVYPPGLVNTANCFLKQRYQQHTAYDVSKLSLEELLPYVAAGNPVLLWLTSDLEECCADYGFETERISNRKNHDCRRISDLQSGQLCIRVCGRSLHVWWGWRLSARTCKYSKLLFETAISAAYSV